MQHGGAERTLDSHPHEHRLPSGDVAAAFGASRLHLRYQPLVAVLDRAPLALEVLARLDHPVLGTLFPSQFVPQLEHAGLARPLTEAVIDSAFADHAAHLGHLNVALSLNVPLEVLIENAFGDWVENRRIALGIAAHSLIIELTESQPVAKLNRTERRRLSTAMSRLRALGYRLAIDDFGPDMPHRQMLLTLPFDLLKLDKGVVNDRAHRGVLAQAVQAAHRKGLQVVAEGVEDDAGWDRMAALGVEYVQGFLVCKPLACRQVEAWMNDWRRVPA